MAIKRVLACGIFLLAVSGLFGQWKEEVAGLLGEKKDFEGVVDYISKNLEKLEAREKPIAYGLLAYGSSQLGRREDEANWVVAYFEATKGQDVLFDFLDESTQWELLNYFYGWKARYPLVTEISLLGNSVEEGLYPPASLTLGVEIRNEALFKFSFQGKVLKGGLFKAGLNTISIETGNFFENSGSYVYLLELKAGELIIKKEIEVEVELEIPETLKKVSAADSEIEYRLSMFVGDDLIVSSKKVGLSSAGLGIKIDLPPIKVPYDPDYPIKRNKPGYNFVSISDMATLVSEVIKELKKLKKPKEVVQSAAIQKSRVKTVVFPRKDAEGVPREIKAVVRIKEK